MDTDEGTNNALQREDADHSLAPFLRNPLVWILIVALSVASATTTGIALYEYFSQFVDDQDQFLSTATLVLAGTLTFAFQLAVVMLSIWFAGHVQSFLTRSVTFSEGHSKPPIKHRGAAVGRWMGGLFKSFLGAALMGALLVIPLAFSVLFSYATFHRAFEPAIGVKQDALTKVSGAYASLFNDVQKSLDRELVSQVNALNVNVTTEIADAKNSFGTRFKFLRPKATWPKRETNPVQWRLLSNRRAQYDAFLTAASMARQGLISKQQDHENIRVELENLLEQLKKLNNGLAVAKRKQLEFALLFEFEFGGCDNKQFYSLDVTLPNYPDTERLEGQSSALSFESQGSKNEILIDYIIKGDRRAAERCAGIIKADPTPGQTVDRYVRNFETLLEGNALRIENALRSGSEVEIKSLLGDLNGEGKLCKPSSTDAERTKNRAGCHYEDYNTSVRSIRSEQSQILIKIQEVDDKREEERKARLAVEQAKIDLERIATLDSTKLGNVLEIADNEIFKPPLVEIAALKPTDEFREIEAQIKIIENKLINKQAACEELVANINSAVRLENETAIVDCQALNDHANRFNSILTLASSKQELEGCSPKAVRAGTDEPLEGEQILPENLTQTKTRATEAIIRTSNVMVVANPEATDVQPLIGPKTLDVSRDAERLRFSSGETMDCLIGAASAAGVLQAQVPVNTEKSETGNTDKDETETTKDANQEGTKTISDSITKFYETAQVNNGEKSAKRSLDMLLGTMRGSDNGGLDVRTSLLFAGIIDVMILILGLLVSMRDAAVAPVKRNPLGKDVSKVFEHDTWAWQDLMETMGHDPSQKNDWKACLQLNELRDTRNKAAVMKLASLAPDDVWINPNFPERINVSGRLVDALSSFVPVRRT